MNTKRKNLDDLFALLKDVRPAQPGPAPDEVRAILGSAPAEGAAPRGNILNRTTAMTALIVSILAGAAALYVMRDQPAQPEQPRAPIAAPPPQARPALPNIPSPAIGTAAPDRAVQAEAAPPAPQARPAAHGDGLAQAPRTTRSNRASIGAPSTPARDFTRTDLEPPPHNPVTPLKHEPISGIRILELTNEEMARLGITVRKGEVEVYGEERLTIGSSTQARALQKLGYDTTRRDGLVRIKVTAGPARIESRTLPYTSIDTVSRVVPIIVSSDWIEETSRNKSETSALVYLDRSPLLELFGMTTEELNANIFSDSSSTAMRSQEERNSKLANRLIPIRVRLQRIEDNAPANGTGECVLWYFPTDEFVAALPEHYSVPLRKELDLIAGVDERKLPPGEMCQRLTGETFFDYCRNSSGALAVISAYPNPSHGEVTCRFSLTEGRTLSFALYDISGKHLRDLTDARRMEAGHHDVNLKIEGAGSGAYLIAMKTDRGEQAVQRVIVE